MDPRDGYAVVIDSIGSASPVVHKVLAEGLNIPSDVMLKTLYHAPSVMARNLDAEIAEQSADLLTKLGLEARSVAPDAPLPPSPELVDVALYLRDASLLPQVCVELREFIGCDQNAALNMLQQEPCVILGGVSRATAEALASRVSAEVSVCNPRKSSYTLFLRGNDTVLLRHLEQHLRSMKLPFDFGKSPEVKGLNYDQSQRLWAKFQSGGLVEIVNEGFQRYELLLTGVSPVEQGQKEALVRMTGMPEAIADKVLANLPIQLDESVASDRLEPLMEECRTAGLIVEAKRIEGGPRHLVLDKAKDWSRTAEVLKRFLPEGEIPKEARLPFLCPLPMGDVLSRYALGQLQAVGCRGRILSVEELER